ncbi:MAG: AAA family ATPase [Candidatus Saccharibacteria bacterium]|nr:AAA family ATPase [Candidatus Saccharibacteria bacterium]
MEPRLIIIRGNSCSGKSTIAKRLKVEMGQGTLLVPQDVVRRDMLGIKDTAGNPSIQLIHDIVLSGKSMQYDVILEGILSVKKYGKMLHELIAEFNNNTHAYYFDIPFEETIQRYKTKPNRAGYSEEHLKLWWKDKDYLNIKHEQKITASMSEDQIIAKILQDFSR